MLKIERRANGDVVFTVSGRLIADNVSELAALLAAEAGGRTLVLDTRMRSSLIARLSGSCGSVKATAPCFGTVRPTSANGSRARKSSHDASGEREDRCRGTGPASRRDRGPWLRWPVRRSRPRWQR